LFISWRPEPGCYCCCCCCCCCCSKPSTHPVAGPRRAAWIAPLARWLDLILIHKHHEPPPPPPPIPPLPTHTQTLIFRCIHVQLQAYARRSHPDPQTDGRNALAYLPFISATPHLPVHHHLQLSVTPPQQQRPVFLPPLSHLHTHHLLSVPTLPN